MAAYISTQFLRLETFPSTFKHKHKQSIHEHLWYQIYSFSSMDIVLAVMEVACAGKAAIPARHHRIGDT